MDSSFRPDGFSRRQFLARASAWTTGALAVSVLAACGGAASTPASSAPASSPSESASRAEAPASSASASAPRSASQSALPSTANRDATLAFNQGTAISSLDPVNPLAYPAAYEGLFLVAEGLVQFDEKMLPQPALAALWKTMPDQKTWDFTLRSGVTFQDGTAFDAQAVKTNFDRMLDPKGDPTQQAIWSNFDSVSVVSPTTVRIVTKAPFASTLLYLAHGSAVILSPAALQKQGSKIGLSPVGTGPYQVSSFEPGVALQLARNSKWWNGMPALANVRMAAAADARTRVSSLQAGQAQLIDTVPATDLPALKANAALKAASAPTWVTTYLVMNTAHGPLADANVRKALAYAVDVKSIVSGIFRGEADPLDSPLASTMPGYSKVGSVTYNTATAQDMLSKAGYQLSGGKLMKNGQQLALTFTAPTGLFPNDTAVAQAIQAQLQKLGADVTLRTQPASAYFTFIRQTKPDSGYGDLYLWAFNPSNGDPGYTLAINFGNPGTPAALWNHSFLDSPQIQDVIHKQAQTVDQNQRFQLLAQAQKLIDDAQPAVWLYVPRNDLAMTKKLQNLTVLPTQFVIPRGAYLEK